MSLPPVLVEFDAANYLDDDKTIAAYLEAAAADGDPELLSAAIDDVARARARTARLNRSTDMAAMVVLFYLLGCGTGLTLASIAWWWFAPTPTNGETRYAEPEPDPRD